MRKLLPWALAVVVCGLPLAALGGPSSAPSGNIGVSYTCEGVGDSAFTSGAESADIGLQYDFADGTGGNLARVGLAYSTAISATSSLANDVFIGLPAAATTDTCLIGGSVNLTQPITYTHVVTDTVVIQIQATVDGWRAEVPTAPITATLGSDTSFGFNVGVGSDFLSESFVLDGIGLTSNQPGAWTVDQIPGGGVSVSGTMAITSTLTAPTGPFTMELFADQFAFVPSGSAGISITNTLPADAFRFEVVSLTPGVDLVSLGVAAPPIDDPQTGPQQKCLTGLNKALAKVVKAQAKLNEFCVKAATKGKESSAQTCVLVDPKGKVQKASEKAMKTDEKKCQKSPDQLPTFSYVPASFAYYAAMSEGQAYLGDLLGPNADVAIPSDRGEAGCQQGVLKSGDKALLAIVAEAIKAKKAALKNGAGSPEELESAMLAALSGSKKVPKLVGKVEATAGKKCADVTDLNFLFPGTAAFGATPASVAGEAIRAGHCRACRVLNTFDDLSLDCDLFDDGVGNASCS